MKSTMPRRDFNRASIAALLAVVAAGRSSNADAQQQHAASGTRQSSRRDVIKQDLPGNPARVITLVEVTYPPGTGSPAHVHANGVMAYVVSGLVASQVGDGPERTYSAGEAWWEPAGAIHRVSRNPSSTEPATLLAIYIAPRDATSADLMKPL
ncbi:cupin domain-containing protein [Bradyrhizobium acaciae]|uniref:cupin domain-containing protein n=1 Tax=Bradyrhizobium acaciae TaxID=2683706 RepID=UPI001E59D7F6|nr:cupin domain-containing protein [Bradyrhizobium acaciae]MCC8980861.1 cupin domain-containing protein [Bradyrhizobium acaciae]